MKNLLAMAMALMAAAFSCWTHAGVVSKQALTLDGAKQVAAAAMAEARRLGAPGGIVAVVDDGGNLMYLERLDNSFPAGANISIGKARTAALFKKPTKVFEDIVNKGRTTMVALPDFTPLQGGIPIEYKGQIVGAVGVSGAASAQQDEELASAGAAAVRGFDMAEHATGPATYFDRQRVEAAFAKGMPLLETADYKVHASRRDVPGQVEVHSREADVIYVLQGSATFVTGGTLVDGKAVAANEIRGASIDGGSTQQLGKGDVVVVPAGTPHWFKAVQGPFLYFVVKPIKEIGL